MISTSTALSIRHTNNQSRDHVLVWLLLFGCGNPFVSFYLDKYVYIVSIVLIFLVFKPKFSAENKQTAYRWIALLTIIFIGQLLVLKSISYLACANYMAKFLTGFCIAVLLGRRFKDAYLSVMTVLCVISLFFFFLQLTGFTIPSLLPSTSAGSIGIYTIHTPSAYSNYRLRNCGMFWEPGAFAGYINVAFMLFINNLSELFRKHRGKVVILLLALLSTLSTTGYVCVGLIMLFYVMESNISKPIKMFLLAITVVMAAFAFMRLDFLGEKVTEQFQNASELTADSNEHSRFGSVIIDWFYIQLHPLFGNGFSLSTRYAYHLQFYDAESLMGFGNGFTGIIGTLGIPFMLYYLYSYYRNKTLTRWLFMLVFVILALQGEQYMNYPLFLMLPFVNYGAIKEVARK